MAVNDITRAFVDELAIRPDVVGVVLFGSWARGDNRPDSDVDLVVILTSGYHRGVEHRGSQAFEIIYTTADAAVEFYAANRDDAAALWAVAQIVHDTGGVVARLAERSRAIVAEGRPPLAPGRVAHARFDVDDQLRHVAAIVDRDPATASLLLTTKVAALTELYFELRGAWIPPPKQRIAQLPPAVAALVRDFYAATPRDQLPIANQLVRAVFAV